jgi:uncharacterized membrane protein
MGVEATRHPGGRRLTTAGLLLGVGLGGFADGIVLHQILQWHHMLTGTGDDRLGLPAYPATSVAGLETNTLWDGLFHATTWVFVVAGLWLLHRAWRAGQVPRARRVLLGLLLAGWGLFNLVEGTVDHHLLGIHHVREGPGRLWWDLAFLASGALLLLGGWALYRSGLRREGATA